MAYFEMILLVLVAMTGLVVLALVVSSRPVHHLHGSHPTDRTPADPSATPSWRRTPSTPPSASRTATRRHTAARCSRQAAEWARLMDAPEPRPTTGADR